MKWLPLLIFALFGFYLVGNNFYAQLGIIDDHEIAMFLGNDGKITISEIPSIIASTEIGRWGTYQRFRPSYYTLRMMETALWRDNAKLWYGARYFMLVVSMYLLWLTLSHFFPKIVSYFFVFYLMTQPFWVDLWTRLGPSEIYTVPALFMFAYGILTNRLWLIAAGYLIAVGSKENFLFLLPCLLLYGGYLVYQKKITTKEIYTYIILVIYTCWIVGGIYLGTSRTGADVYGTTISYSERLAMIYKYKRYIVESRQIGPALLVFGVSFVGMIIAMYRSGIKQVLRNPVVHFLFFVMILLGIIASQYLFYNNNFPTNMRYDFPVMILFPILQLVAVRMVIQVTPSKLKTIITPIIYLCLVIGLGYMITSRGYNLIREAAMHNAQTTASFANKIDKISPLLKKNQEIPLYFVSSHYLDYEPIVSVARYLDSRGVNNKFMLVYKDKSNEINPVERDLTKRMEMVMRGEDDPDRVFGRFAPTKAGEEPCYIISYGGAEPQGGCEVLAHF